MAQPRLPMLCRLGYDALGEGRDDICASKRQRTIAFGKSIRDLVNAATWTSSLLALLAIAAVSITLSVCRAYRCVGGGSCADDAGDSCD